MNISKFGKDFQSPFIGKQMGLQFGNKNDNDSDESDKLSYKGEENNFTRLGRKS
jgi:hypothetical protein